MSGRTISRAESWETVYQAFQNINFTAFDYQSIKESMIDYLKLYFPETFNDYIESSEFVALIELFAYLGEIVAYRVDMNSHENFLPTAQRKQSVLRLAKLISYNVSRNIPARGLVKFTSISTTEPVYDIRGINLANTKITWNDPANPNWKDQFFLVFDKVLQQSFGSVAPSDRVQVQDVLFELYNLNNIPTTNGVVPFSVSVSGNNYPVELVPVALNESGPYERRPEINSTMKIVYGSDGLGDGSSGTGFFAMAKQGTLQLVTNTFDGVTPNQMFEVGVFNINETDLWVNNVDPDTLQITRGNEEFIRNNRAGEWVPVDLAHAQNIIYNTNLIRNKFEIETLEDDNVRLIFGDGEFANIPSGLFHVWVRVSANADVVIPQSSINEVPFALNYVDSLGILRTLSITMSAVNTFQNAAPSEDIEHIRRMAPAVYYTQDRMVNARDYNTFMLQDQTILAIRSFNRTFAGESNYVDYVTFNDPSGAYDNVKIFGDDLAVYVRSRDVELPDINPSFITEVVIRNYVEPLLSNVGLTLNRSNNGDGDNAGIRAFTDEEFSELVTFTDSVRTHSPIYIFYDTEAAKWLWDDVDVTTSVDDPNVFLEHWYIKLLKGADEAPWKVSHKTSVMVAESAETKFWFHGDGKVVNYDSLTPGYDEIVILRANANKNRDGIFDQNKNLIVLDHEYVSTGLGPIGDIGLPNIHQFSTTYEDVNGDGAPDLPGKYSFKPLNDIIDPVITIRCLPAEGKVKFPFPVIIDNVESGVTGFKTLLNINVPQDIVNLIGFIVDIGDQNDINSLFVFVDGILQETPYSYTITQNTITMTNPAVAGQTVAINKLGAPMDVYKPAFDRMFVTSTLNQSTFPFTTFTINETDPYDVASLMVFINGVYQSPTSYEIGVGGDSITTDVPLLSGDIVSFTKVDPVLGLGFLDIQKQDFLVPASSSVTIVPFTGINLSTLNENLLWVFVNGVHQYTTYTITHQGYVQFNTPLAGGDLVQYVIFSPNATRTLDRSIDRDGPAVVSILDGYKMAVDVDVPNQTLFVYEDFILDVPASEEAKNSVFVFVSGLLQNNSSYDVFSTHVEFNTPLTESDFVAINKIDATSGTERAEIIRSSITAISGQTRFEFGSFTINTIHTRQMASVHVFVNGLYQSSENYTIDDTGMELAYPLNGNDIVEFVYINPTVNELNLDTISQETIVTEPVVGISFTNQFIDDTNVNLLWVFVNGVHQHDSYTIVSGRLIFNEPLAVGTVVNLILFSEILDTDDEITGEEMIDGDITISPSSAVQTYDPNPHPRIAEGVVISEPVTIRLKEYVYFTRPKGDDSYWEVMPTTVDTLLKYLTDNENEYTRLPGRYPLNFMWMHRSPNHHLIDPAATNIVDTYIITRGYYTMMRRWLDGYLSSQPTEPTPLDLKTSYAYLIDNKMISDTVVLHPGKFKILFGEKAAPELQAKIKVIKSVNSYLTDNQIKLQIIATVNEFFDVSKWEFGENFYFSELAAVIHSVLPVDVDSVVLVPTLSTNYFGDLFQVRAREDELFMSNVTVSDIEIINSLSRAAIRQKI